ncbi:MAG: hypothetical protein FLDDKLPJ_03425 [Phycisphaerae bacterium]|nr:hypothetical protein [Phycisphaerae bacterium]
MFGQNRWIGIAAGCIVLAGATPLPAQQATDRRLVNVAGQGQISVPPDEVVVALGVETFNADLTGAKADNDARIRKLLELAPQFNVAETSVRVDPVRVQPSYQDRDGRKDLTGYFVRRSVELTLTDLERFEALMSAAIESGANYIQGVNFRSTRAAQLQEEAKMMAVEDAKRRANTLTALLGVKVARVYSLGEAQFGSYCSYNAGWGYVSWSGGEAPNRKVIEPTAGAKTPQIGRVELTATVNVAFELE